MLRAAWELTRERTRLDIVVNGKPAVPRLGAVRLSPSAGLLDAGLVIQNRGDAPIWRDVSVQGTPSCRHPRKRAASRSRRLCGRLRVSLQISRN